MQNSLTDGKWEWDSVDWVIQASVHVLIYDWYWWITDRKGNENGHQPFFFEMHIMHYSIIQRANWIHCTKIECTSGAPRQNLLDLWWTSHTRLSKLCRPLYMYYTSIENWGWKLLEDIWFDGVQTKTKGREMVLKSDSLILDRVIHSRAMYH